MSLQSDAWNHRDDLVQIEFQQEAKRLTINGVLGPQPATLKDIWVRWRNFIIFILVLAVIGWGFVAGIGYVLWRIFKLIVL